MVTLWLAKDDMILPLSSWEAFMVKEGQSNMQLPRDGKRDLGKEGRKQGGSADAAVRYKRGSRPLPVFKLQGS